METSTLLIIGIILLTLMLVITIFVLILYSGLFDSVQVGAGKPLVSNLKVVYKYGKGPTKDMGALFTEVTSIAPKLKCFGVYYDNPTQEHSSRQHHWAVGCVLAEGKATPDSDLLVKFREEGYKTFEFPEVSHVVHTEFPCRTQLSILLGIFKVYPQLDAYVKRQRVCAHPWLEIYNGEVIYYMAPLAKQNEFYLPETDPDYDELDSETHRPMFGEGQRDVGVKGESSGVKGHEEMITNHVPGESGDGPSQMVKHGSSSSCNKAEADQPAGQKLSDKNESELLSQSSAIPETKLKQKVMHSESKSMTPAGRVNVVTDVQGRRASSSISRSRSGSEGQVTAPVDKTTSSKHPPRSASEATDVRLNPGRIQESGITSTSDAGLFSDSDTLTDPDASVDSISFRSGSHVSSIISEDSRSCAESPYASESSFLSESSFSTESFASGSETGTLSTETSSASLLMELSSDSGSDNDTVAVTVKSTSQKVQT